MERRKALAEAFNELLEGQWDLFVTVTFRWPREVDKAMKSFKHFLKYVNVPIGVGMLYEKYVEGWMFVERNAEGVGVHVHALIRGIDPMNDLRLERKCRQKFGESKVLRYDPKKGARYYLSYKYGSPKLEDFDYFKVNSKVRKRKQLCGSGVG